MYLNKVQIIGNITRKPELKALPSGNNVTNFSVATNRTWKDKDGSKQEAVEFHNIVCFGKQAENIARYMDKGSQIYIEGRLQTRKWEDKDGNTRYITEIIAETAKFGVKRSNTTQDTTNQENYPENADLDDIEDSINPDDIPF